MVKKASKSDIPDGYRPGEMSYWVDPETRNIVVRFNDDANDRLMLPVDIARNFGHDLIGLCDHAEATFHLGDILSVVAGVQASPTDMRGITAILAFMVRAPLAYGSMSIFAARPACSASLLRQHPQLAGFDAAELAGLTPENYWTKMGPLLDRFGERLPVRTLAAERDDDSEGHDA